MYEITKTPKKPTSDRMNSPTPTLVLSGIEFFIGLISSAFRQCDRDAPGPTTDGAPGPAALPWENSREAVAKWSPIPVSRHSTDCRPPPRRDTITFTRNTSTATASTKAPIVESKFIVPHPGNGG